MSISNAAHCSMIGGGAKVLTAKDYVQSGLVALWDGEWNVADGVHDSNATKVKNLVSGELGDLDLYGGYIIGKNYVQFDGISGLGMADKLTNTGWTGMTIEYVFSPAPTGDLGNCGWTLAGSSNKRPSIACDASNGRFYVFMTGGNASAYAGLVRQKCSLVATGSDGILVGYINGNMAISRTDPHQDFSTTKNSFRVGAYGGVSNQNIGFSPDTMHRVGIYSRALTAAEIAANHAVDKIRFGLP